MQQGPGEERRDASPSSVDLGGSDPRVAIERRATVRLLRYWLSIRRSGAVPLFRDFDPHRNPVPWENCFLARSEAEDGPVAFDHIGGALWVALDRPAVVAAERPPLPEFLAELAAQIGAVLARGEPAERSGEFPLRPPDRLLFRSILLPFADAARRPYYALGAVTFRIARGEA